MIDTKIQKEKYILVCVYGGAEELAEASLEELSDLTETAGAESIGRVIQLMEHPNPATYVGKGKAEEIREIAGDLGADGIICDDELSPVQMRNLSDILEIKVIDRTILILDIFASHATTREGKLQVEMAQLRYRASHLGGMGKALSRLGGGIGTRGPGETKLETDRRVIRRRIAALSGEIGRLKQARDITRHKRINGLVPIAAIVGYTNAGKSTLLNTLTAAEVLEEDKLFATLDPTTRICSLPEGMEILLTDTVGFINKLPHNLIDAFRSTLEEAVYADILIHVVDLSDSQIQMHMKVVYDTLRDLEALGKPVITVFNKADLAEGGGAARDPLAEASFRISAKTGEGLERLKEALRDIMLMKQERIEEVIPYADAGRIDDIRKRGRLLKEEYEADGIHICAVMPGKKYADPMNPGKTNRAGRDNS